MNPAGILRPARRPRDWVAPGPTPPPPDDAALWPGPGEDLCYLAGNWRILQRVGGHRFSLDDLVTAHFATRQARPRRFLDLGCGIGSVLMFLAWRFPEASGEGVEAQAVSAALARRSLAWNGAAGRCRVHPGDFRDPSVTADLGTFDLVTGTPPYFPRGTGVESDGIQKAPCRFEHRGGIEDYCLAARPRLGAGAPFVACAPSWQRDRVERAAREAGLSIERWRDIVSREGKAPLLSVFSMRVTATLVEEPPLIVRDRQGRRTEEFIALRADMGMPP